MRAATAPRATPPVVVLAPPPPEPAPPSPPAAPPEPALDEGPEHRFELSLAGATFSPSFTDVRFRGTGLPAGSAVRKTLSVTGREVGLRRPTFWGAELALGYRHRYFGVLALGTIATIDGVDSTPTNPQAAAQLGAGSVTAYGGGIEAFGSVPLGPFTVSLGAAAGLRGFSAPLLGLMRSPTSRTSEAWSWAFASRARAL
ncbi:MAG: hypothetical protein JST00_02205 [Deltaproteobacteria bacterium]|nr:hypothetical protein [Deltaproteobacteria bacterium]